MLAFSRLTWGPIMVQETDLMSASMKDVAIASSPEVISLPMNLYILVKSHSNVRLVGNITQDLEDWRSMRGHILVRNHSVAQYVIRSSPKKATSRLTWGFTRERNHSYVNSKGVVVNLRLRVILLTIGESTRTKGPFNATPATNASWDQEPSRCTWRDTLRIRTSRHFKIIPRSEKPIRPFKKRWKPNQGIMILKGPSKKTKARRIQFSSKTKKWSEFSLKMLTTW